MFVRVLIVSRVHDVKINKEILNLNCQSLSLNDSEIELEFDGIVDLRYLKKQY